MAIDTRCTLCLTSMTFCIGVNLFLSFPIVRVNVSVVFTVIIFHPDILVAIECVFETISTGLFDKIEIKNRNDLGELILIRYVYFSRTLTATAS